MSSMYTKAVGTKFHADGSLRYFPGNTIVSMCTGIEPLYSELVWAQERYKEVTFANKLSFLPPSSFHMTVFDLLCDEVRSPEHWSNQFPTDTPIETTDRILRDKLSDVHFPESIEMSLDEATVTGLKLLPANAAVQKMLADFRTTVANATGIKHPNHDRYRFHITFAYVLQPLNTEEKEEFSRVADVVLARLKETVDPFVIGQPRFVLFDDMGDFQEHLVRRQG